MQSSTGGPNASAILLRQACLGERSALGQLLEQLRPWMRVLAAGRLGDRIAARVDASDVVQQTCLSVFNRINQFHGQDVAQFMAWVKEIHSRNILDEVRRHLAAEERSVGKEQPLAEVDATVLADESVHRPLFLGEDAIALAQAMDQLPPSQKKAVAMRYLEELPVSRISQLMNLTPDAVTSLISRGLIQLRTKLGSPDKTGSGKMDES